MAEVSIRGKENILKHFTNINDPYWKLFNAKDTKTPIQTLLSVNNTVKSKQYFSELLDSLDQNGTYVLDTFTVATAKETGGMKWSKPDTTTCFSLADTGTALLMGDENKKKTEYVAPSSMRDTIELIRENATLTVELSVFKGKWEEGQKLIKELQAEIEELNKIIDEYEEEESEEEESVGGVPKNIEEALTGLIHAHGGTIIENLVNKGIDKDPFKDNATGNSEKSVEGEGGQENDDQEAEQEIKMNGIGNDIPDLNSIIQELMQRDINLHKHLYKLLLIARQKPNTFKTFLHKLETF